MTLPTNQERRTHVRARCLKGARVVLGNNNSTLACRIRNQSETGVRLAMDETQYVPPSFTLVSDGTTKGHVCEVSWRSATEIGARMVGATGVAAQGFNKADPLMRKRKLEAVGRYPV